MTPIDDETILNRVRGGDGHAMADLIEKYRPQLVGYIEKNLSDNLRRKVEAQDILQEVSIHAVRGVGEMDLSERDCFGWLCQLAQRRIIDAHRKYFGAQKRSADREVGMHAKSDDGSRRGMIDLLAASMTTASQAFSRKVKQARLAEALEDLPEQTREVLHLRYVDGLATKEIAERIDKKDGAVRVMLTRAVQRLQEILLEAEE